MSDYKLTPTGKLFFGSLISYLKGGKSYLKLKAQPEVIKAIGEILKTSKAYEDEANKGSEANIDTVIQKMREKNLAIAEFTKLTSRPWFL